VLGCASYCDCAVVFGFCLPEATLRSAELHREHALLLSGLRKLMCMSCGAVALRESHALCCPVFHMEPAVARLRGACASGLRTVQSRCACLAVWLLHSSENKKPVLLGVSFSEASRSAMLSHSCCAHLSGGTGVVCVWEPHCVRRPGWLRKAPSHNVTPLLLCGVGLLWVPALSHGDHAGHTVCCCAACVAIGLHWALAVVLGVHVA